MATYFHGNSEIQASTDGLQTLIFMNPAYNVSYPDSQPSQQPPQNNNFAFLNLPHAPPSQTQHFISTTVSSAVSPQNQHDPSNFHGFFPSNVNYNNLYNPQLEMGAARESPRAPPQGLSLTLSSQQTPRYNGSQPDDIKSPSSVSGVSVSGVNGMQSHVVLSSKYLRAAQELLDEVVNASVNKTIAESSKNVGECSRGSENGVSGGGEGSGKRGAELSTVERQEIQMKKAKLVNMLDEVEQRYKQYYHQMQVVISWFEQATRVGSAKTYTDLALQTISKQFRCLKDAILGQIKVASKSLGEEDSLVVKAEGSRLKYVDNQIRQQRALQQLGMIQQNAWRPQRGLPERSVSVLRAWLFEHFLHPYPKDSDKVILAKQTGLTRSQVSNWFINARVRLWKPMVEEMYKEEMKGRENNGTDDKMSKSEENEDSASKSSAPEVKAPVIKNQNKNFVPKQDNTTPIISMTTNSTSPTGTSNTGFNLIGFSEMDSITQGSPKKPRNPEILHPSGSIPWMNIDSKPNNVSNNDQMSMKFGNERHSRDEFSLMGAPTNFIGGFGSYPIAELGRFGAEAEQFQAPYSGNGVSLTLGLPHCENLSMAGSHPTFLPNQLGRGVEIGEANDFSGMSTPTSAHSTSVYEEINIQNRKRFAAQLMPDFVT